MSILQCRRKQFRFGGDDGSAIMEVKMCPEASRRVIEAGLLSLIKKHIDEIENEQNTETSRS